MMKKNLVLLFIFCSIFSFAQCSITGKTSLRVGEEDILGFTGQQAQCSECHLWIGLGNGNKALKSDKKLKTVKFLADSPGRYVVSLNVLTENGFMQCAKNIDVLMGETAANTGSTINVSSAPEIQTATPCDIEIGNFKEVKYDAGIVSFFPESSTVEYKYNWTVTYLKGEQAKSFEKVPQFPYGAANPIKSVKLQIVSNRCLKEFTKTYDTNYWTFF